MRILAFDAGNTSGTALWTPDGIVLGKLVGREMAYGFLRAIEDLDALAYEQFVFRPGHGLLEKHADVVYINGAIEAEASRRGIPFYRYTSRDTKHPTSKTRVTDDMLKECGWWPGFGLRTGGHSADAARVLYLTMKINYPLEFPCLTPPLSFPK